MPASVLTRRDFAALAASFGAALALGRARAAPGAAWQERRDLYPQGVASGDPDTGSVILWTRRPPMAAETSATLRVEVASDEAFTQIAAEGSAAISAETDWTCRILAAGLKPASEYWYRFTDEAGNGSRIGRTLTAPANDDPRAVRFAFVSCQDVTLGACNAWRRMIYDDAQRPAEDRLGFVLHLGDFIYELVSYSEDQKKPMFARRLRDNLRYPHGEKIDDFHIPTTLDDYRTAYRVYLTDPDLQDARAQFPFVAVWDNHEFSWQGYQSQQVFDGKTRPAQSRKLMANQAWFEFQPARVKNPGGDGLTKFVAPEVKDTPITEVDELGTGTSEDNLKAITSLVIYRTLRWGGNLDLIITDNRSFNVPGTNVDNFTPPKPYRFAYPDEVVEITDGGRAYNDGKPPATIRFGGADVPNPAIKDPPQSCLGVTQRAWFKEQLAAATAPWKIWGHSFGNLIIRIDYQNLPAGLVKDPWPGAAYGTINGGYYLERAEILDMVREKGITGFGVVAGDKHSFWAGFLSKELPPGKFEPQAVEFITGSISAVGLFEVLETRYPKDDALRPLFLHDAADGKVLPAINMSILHGVKSSLKLHETGDVQQALAVSNPDVSPNVKFADYAGHGFATVKLTPDLMETEFVAIPRPVERIDAPDGGPLVYRVVHRVKLWRAGEAPVMEQQVLEGTPPLAV